jgi:hypothetical protein
MKYGPTARIIQNHNTFTGWNHLFVSIPGRHGPLFIEPQATGSSPFMVDNWGSKYDPQFNRIVTEYYRRLMGIEWR